MKTLFLASLYLIYEKRFSLGWAMFAVAAAAKSHLFAAGPLFRGRLLRSRS